MSVGAARVSYIAVKFSGKFGKGVCICVWVCVCVCACAPVCVMQFFTYCQHNIGVILAHGINTQDITAFQVNKTAEATFNTVVV